MRAVTSSRSFGLHPLAVLALALGAGIMLACLVNIPVTVLLGAGATAFCLAVGALLKARFVLASLTLILSTMLAGATLETIDKQSIKTDQVRHLLDSGMIAIGDPAEVTGTVARPPEAAPDRFYLTLRVEGLRYKTVERPASGTVLLMAPMRGFEARDEYERLELRYGARVRVMTVLNRAENFRNPGVSSFTEYLERKGYDATGVIKSPLLVERLDDRQVFLPLALLYQWRQSLLARINQTFSPETAGVLDAALLGNRYFLSHAAAERFRSGGTFHVLVISGLHITFIAGVVFLVMRRLTRRLGVQFVVSVVVLWGYALAVGAEASVMRAALMFTLVALPPLIARQAQSLNVLGATALGLLVWEPGNLFDPSFQLTFLSVLMIITLGWPLLQRMQAVGAWQPTRETPYPPSCPRWFRQLSEALFWSERRYRQEMAASNFKYKLFKSPMALHLERYRIQGVLRFALGATVISASVQLGLLPLLVLYFHRLSIASLILNIGVGVLMAMLGLIALATLAIGQLSATLVLPLVKLAEIVNWLMVHSVDPFARWGMASARLPEYTGPASVVYVLYYIPLVALLVALARWNPLRPSALKRRRLGTRYCSWLAAGALVLFLGTIVFHPFSSGLPDGRLRIDFLDVGQGDAALITMPDATTLLIDGGGRPRFDRGSAPDEEAAFESDTRSIGEAVVSEYLWWRGLDRVDYVLATHADADHIDGLNDVLRNFKVRGAIVARAPDNDPEFRRFAATAMSAKVPLLTIAAGDVLRFGDVSVETLWPVAIPDGKAPAGNNQSLVLRMRYGEKTFLLTGDLEKEGESALLRAGMNLDADLVKVAHHGSRTSSTAGFVAATHAGLAIISVGRTSIFGHPHKEVVERWRAIGAEVLTTGERGTVTITTDGRNLHLSTFVK